MLNKISISLFHHKYIGKFIAQKFIYAILYFFVMSILMIIPYIMLLSLDESITRSEAEAVEVLVRKDTGEATIENYKLETTLDYSFETNYYFYSFSETHFSTNKPTFLFLETKLAYIYSGKLLDELTYEELKIDSLKIDSNTSYSEIEKFISICETIRKENEGFTKGYELFMGMNMIWLNYLISLTILFFITKLANNTLLIKHRCIIAIYAITSNLICDFFAVMTGIRFLQILGFALSAVAAYRASKAIVAIREI